MNLADEKLQIQTLGLFRISIDGKSVIAEWPSETIKELFCSLLSPLDLYISWDRICRSMWDLPATPNSSLRMEELFVRPLKCFLIKELGFDPLITCYDGIRIDQQRICLDALEFLSSAADGLRLLSLNNHAAAHEKFIRAKAIYTGCYLPGLSGKIISNTRTELEALYMTAVIEAMPLTQKYNWPGYERRAKPELYVKSSRRSLQSFEYNYDYEEKTHLTS